MVLSLGLLIAFLPLLGTSVFYTPAYKIQEKTPVVQNAEKDITANNETNNQETQPLENITSTNETVEAPKETNQARPETVPLTSRSGSRDIRVIKGDGINYTFTEEEIEILERIVQAEVGNGPYNGKLAVTNVILNRIESPRFPNTVKGVVFAAHQFTPVSNGSYYKVKVNESTKQVVADAINGARIVPKDALYFCTPQAGKNWFDTALRKIDYVAPHNIYGYK